MQLLEPLYISYLQYSHTSDPQRVFNFTDAFLNNRNADRSESAATLMTAMSSRTALLASSVCIVVLARVILSRPGPANGDRLSVIVCTPLVLYIDASLPDLSQA